MARRKKRTKVTSVTFNVVYADGTLSSNRRVSSDLLEDPFGTDPKELALQAIQDQDNRVAERSGQPAREIKSVTRVKD